jgi:hypothetical protein
MRWIAVMNKDDVNLDRMREVVLKLELTQYARTEAQLAKEDLREYIRAELLALRNENRLDRRKQYGTIAFIFTVLVGSDVWAIQNLESRVQRALAEEVEKNRQTAAAVLATETTKMQGQIKNRLDQEFATPRLQRMIGEEARRYTANEAKAYIVSEVETVVRPFRTQIDQSIADTKRLAAQNAENVKKFGDFLQQNEKQYRAEYQKLSKTVGDSESLTKTLSLQVAAQKHRSDISALANDAINNGSRTSFAVLSRILDDTSETTEIRELARSEILKLKIFWMTANKTVANEVAWTGPDGKPKAETALTACDLLSALQNNKQWEVRAKAAQLLAAHANLGVPEGLLKAIQSDQQLHVVRDAIRSFSSLTGFQTPDVFGLPYAETWWQGHADETKKKLTKLDCTP